MRRALCLLLLTTLAACGAGGFTFRRWDRNVGYLGSEECVLQVVEEATTPKDLSGWQVVGDLRSAADFGIAPASLVEFERAVRKLACSEGGELVIAQRNNLNGRFYDARVYRRRAPPP